MKDANNTTIVNNVTYNAANQLLTMTFNGDFTETRGYNVLNQLTTLSVPTIVGGVPTTLTYN